MYVCSPMSSDFKQLLGLQCECMCVFDLQPGPGFVCYFCAHFLFLCFYYSTILLFAISKFWSSFAFVHYFKVLQFFAISRFESKALLVFLNEARVLCVSTF